MLLSIIIPVYNCEKYIRKCLDSIVEKCDISIVEIILINDGSTDHTDDVVKSLPYFNSINYINNTNYGVSYTRNLGVKTATGKYLMFIDADDYFDDEWFEIVYPYLEKDYDIIYFNDKIDEEKICDYIIGNNRENICVGGPVSKLFNRDFLIKNKILFDEELIIGEDMIFNLESVLKANNIIVDKKIFYYYRQYLGSATKKFNFSIFESDRKFHTRLNKILKNSKLTENEKENIKLFCLANAVISIYDRISYIPNYPQAKKEIKKLYKSFYKDLSLLEVMKCLKNFKNKMKFLIYKMRFNYVLYLLFFFNHKKVNKNVGFIKI